MERRKKRQNWHDSNAFPLFWDAHTISHLYSFFPRNLPPLFFLSHSPYSGMHISGLQTLSIDLKSVFVFWEDGYKYTKRIEKFRGVSGLVKAKKCWGWSVAGERYTIEFSRVSGFL